MVRHTTTYSNTILVNSLCAAILEYCRSCVCGISEFFDLAYRYSSAVTVASITRFSKLVTMTMESTYRSDAVTLQHGCEVSSRL